MVQKNLLCPSCRNEEFISERKTSWEEIRGLTWLFCEDCVLPREKEFKVKVSCA